MSDVPAFAGFTKATVRFYADLGRNNTKAWFEAHRTVYDGRVLAPAKLNLALDVVGLLPNGYHDLDMVMQTIILYERLTLRRADGTVTIFSNRMQ